MSTKQKHSQSSGSLNPIFAQVTDQIIEAIEAGTETYSMPWNTTGLSSLPLNVRTGKAYRGINILILWLKSIEMGWNCSKWGTYNQWSEMGCQVNLGEKSTKVVFWDTYLDSEENEEEEQLRIVAKSYSVFNSWQVDGYIEQPLPELCEKERNAHAEAFFINLLSEIRYGGNNAYYHKKQDYIAIPAFQQFHNSEAFYATLAHEHVHWSGNEKRLGRELSGRFGDVSYAMEELVAELGSAFLCTFLGIPTHPRKDHAGYIASWLKVLRSDPKAILSAASKAQQAVDYLIEKSKEEPTLVGNALQDAFLTMSRRYYFS